jgi:hypothetical protein
MDEHVMVSTLKLSESISGSTKVLEHIHAPNFSSSMGQVTICFNPTPNL